MSAELPGVSDTAGAVDDSFSIRASAGEGTEVVLVQSAAARGPATSITRVVGTEGTLWADGDAVWLADGAAPDGRVLEPPVTLPQVDAEATGPLAAMTRLELPPYIALAESFRRAIDASPAPGPVPATFTDGLATMRAVEAVRRLGPARRRAHRGGVGVAA